MKEYNNKVEYIQLNQVWAGLVERAEAWPWSSVRKYSGSVREEASRHATLAIDRVSLPSDERRQI